MLAHLSEKKVDVKHRRVNDQALYQLFLLDPNGVKVELNFDVDEVNSVEDERLLDD
jgi:hypothetical protein